MLEAEAQHCHLMKSRGPLEKMSGVLKRLRWRGATENEMVDVITNSVDICRYVPGNGETGDTWACCEIISQRVRDDSTDLGNIFNRANTKPTLK